MQNVKAYAKEIMHGFNMIVKDFKKKLEELQIQYPNKNIDEMEIGPVFNRDVIMNTVDVLIVPEAAWDKNNKDHDAIGFIWMT